MGIFDELASTPPNALGQSGYSFIDADTLIDKDKNKFRIQGIDAPETEKVLPDGTYKPGTAGGQAYTDATIRLANDLGFTNVKPILGADGRPQKDEFGERTLVDLVNPDTGESFKNRAVTEGIYDPTRFSTDTDRIAAELGQLRREQNTLAGTEKKDDWDVARQQVMEAKLAEGDKQQGFKIRAMDEVELSTANAVGAGRFFHQEGVQQRDKYGRTLSNDSLNPLSDSWEQGWIGVQESAYGMANLLGESWGVEAVADLGEAGVARAQERTAEYANTLTNYQDVDGFWDAIQYVGNNAALSLPYMAITAGGAVATAVTAPVVGATAAVGLGLSAPAAIYSGQIWNEQEGNDKSATIAIAGGVAQATLDRLGLKGITGKGIGSRELLNKAVAELQKRGMTKAVAEQTVANASRRELAGFAGDAAKIAKEQLQAKKVFKELAKDFGISASGEAVTEVGQELIGYMAANSSGENFNFKDLNNRLINAAIAGGTLGGVFSTPKHVSDTLAWADVGYRLDPAAQDKASQGEIYAAEEKATHGRVASIQEIAADARARGIQGGASLQDRIDAHKEKQAGKSTLDRATETALNVSGLWQGAVRNIFTPELQSRSRSARILSDMFGGNLQRVFSGTNFENSKHHKVSQYKNMVSDPNDFYSMLARGKRLTNSVKHQLSDTIYAKLRAAQDKDGNFNPDLIPDTDADKQVLVGFQQQLDKLANKMYADQKVHNADLGYIKNYLVKYKTLDKGAVKKNSANFKSLLRTKHGYSAADADKLVDEILNNDNVDDIEQAFSVVKGGIVPTSHRGRSIGMSEDVDFDQFMEKDLFANVARATKSAARFTAHREFIGENGGVIATLLNDMQNEGVSPAEVNKVAARIQNYLDAESGNYKRATSDLGKSAQALQKNFMMLTTLAGLPLATISSMVELMLVNKGLRKDQIFGKQGSIEAAGKEFANTMWSGAKEVGGFVSRKELDKGGDVFDTGRTERLRDLGYYDWDVGAATVTGVTEVNSWQQRAYEEFFKWTGLQGWTNYTRAARASLAGDYLFDKAQTIYDNRSQPRTREVQEAEEALRNLGIDVDRYVDLSVRSGSGVPLTPEEEAFMADTTREATFNFVNEAIALPQSANRPLIYQDPRFALFTQFQGFIATFTANHIPKLWGEYVKRGTPAMKYNAFATMTTMIMMGFVSQHLKDLIKYDDDDEKLTGSNPHLDTAEYLQRGVRASGLLGTGERILDQFFPIYETRSDNPGEWIFNTSTGESPALGYAKRAASGVGSLVTGDVGRAAKTAVKSAPIFGPFSSVADDVGEAASAWNFNGE